MNMMPRMSFTRSILSLGIALGMTSAVFAQGETGTGQLRGVSNGSGAYDYTLTLNNTGTVPIGTLWYAWIPGQFYLPTVPLSASAPSGWTATINSYSIEYIADSSASALGGGLSLDFQFSSTDTPAALAGDSPRFPGTPVGTSYLYSGGPFSDSGYQFVVESVPEPAAGTFLVSGLPLVLLAKRRFWWGRAVSS